MTKEKIISTIVEKRYKNMQPLEIATYFEKLSPDDKSIVTAHILRGDNSLAKDRIVSYMSAELAPSIDQYFLTGSLPVSIVEELIS